MHDIGVADIELYTKKILERKANDYILYISIASYPHMKEDGQKQLLANLKRIAETYTGEEIIDTARSLAILRSVMSKSPRFQVK